MNLINAKDANGKFVVIGEKEFIKAIGENAVTLFGMDIKSVAGIIKTMRQVGYNPSNQFDIDVFCTQVIAKVPYKSNQKANGS